MVSRLSLFFFSLLPVLSSSCGKFELREVCGYERSGMMIGEHGPEQATGCGTLY